MSLLKIVSIHEDPVFALLKMPDGLFVSGGADRMLCLINHEPKKDVNNVIDKKVDCVRFLDHFQLKTITCLVGIDDVKFASSSLDGTIKIMDMKKNDLEGSLTTNDNSPVNSIDYDKASNMLYAGEECGLISKWLISTKKQVDTFRGHTKRVLQVKIIQADYLASSSTDMTLRVWKISATSETVKVDCASIVRTICPFNETCFAYGDEAGNITVYNFERKASVGAVRAHTGICHQLIQLSQDVNAFCSCGEDKRIVFWNLSSRKKTKEIKNAHFERIIAITELTTGEIVSSGMDQMINIWKIK